MHVLIAGMTAPADPSFPVAPPLRPLAPLAAVGLAVPALALDLPGALAAGGKLAEGGPVETMTVALYGLFLVAFARLAASPAADWAVVVLVAGMAGRELDLDKRLSDPGLLKADLYTGDAALWHKGIGFALIALVLAALASLVRRHGRAWARGLRTLRPWAWWTAGAVLLLIVAKSIDGLGRKLAGFGIEAGENLVRHAGLAEEAMELFVPVALVLALAARPALGPGAWPARTPRPSFRPPT